MLSEVLKKYNLAKEYRRPYERDWKLNVAFVGNRQWVTYDSYSRRVIDWIPPNKKPRLTANIILPVVRGEYAKLTRNKPSFRVTSITTSQDDVAESMISKQYLDYLWASQKFDKTFKRALLWALICGTGFIKTYFNKSAGPTLTIYGSRKSLGDVEIDSCSPFELYIDPFARDISEASWVIHIRLRSPEYVESKYGIKPSPEWYSDTEYSDGTTAAANRSVSGAAVAAPLGVRVLEYWEIPCVKYPNGRYAVIVGHQEIVSGDNPYAHICPIPFTMMNHIPLPDKLYGDSAVSHLRQVNVIYNKLRSDMVENTVKLSNPPLIAPINSLLKEPEFEPGEVIYYNPLLGGKIDQLKIEPFPPQMMNMMMRIYQERDDISGLSDVSRGTVPRGVRSASALAYLLEQDECVDAETEALTKSGWKKYNHLSVGEEILTFDPAKHALEWQPLKGIFVNENYEGELTVLDNRIISSRTTSNHKFWVRTAQTKHRGYFQTTNLIKDHCIPLTAPISNGNIDNPSYDDTFLKLLGVIISDGSYRNDCNAIDISQSMKRNPQKVEYIRALLKQAGVHGNERMNKEKGVLYFYVNSDFSKRIRKVAPEKVPSYEFLSTLSVRQLNLILEGLILGDGHVRKDNGAKTYYSTNKAVADAVQCIGILAGYVTHIRTCKPRDTEWTKNVVEYEVRFKSGPNAGGPDNVARVGKALQPSQHYKGAIWCPSVPSGYWLSRRDGKHNITGNTKLAVTASSWEQMIAAAMQNTLYLAKEFYDIPRIIRILGKDNSWAIRHFKSNDIPLDADVVVEEASTLPKSKVQQQQYYMDLWDRKIITDPSKVLRLTEYGNEQEMYSDFEIDVNHALRENSKMAEGVDVLVEDFHNHPVHLLEHNRFRKSAQYEELPSNTNKIFTLHVADHVNFAAQQQPQQEVV